MKGSPEIWVVIRGLCSYPYPSLLSAHRADLKGQLLPALAPAVPLFSLEPVYDYLGATTREACPRRLCLLSPYLPPSGLRPGPARGPRARASVPYPAFALTNSHPCRHLPPPTPAAAPGRKALNDAGRWHEKGWPDAASRCNL